MRTVRIYGTAANLSKTPPALDGQEVWLANNPRGYQIRLPRALNEWTRWFNLHSRAWMLHKYPQGWKYYCEEAKGRPIYFQKAQPEVASSLAFPREEIQRYFAIGGKPNCYFTASVCWMIALAIYEGFGRIELWGFALSNTKLRTGECYEWERPAFFYWVQQARDRGITVTYQREIEKLPFAPGDPITYDGPLYGYATKPELDWREESR